MEYVVEVLILEPYGASSRQAPLHIGYMTDHPLSDSTPEHTQSDVQGLRDSPQWVEPEVPDPFLVDEQEDDTSDEEQLESSGTISPAQNVSLGHSQPSLLIGNPPVSPLLNINKDVPLPPSNDSEDEEEDIPDVYLPSLVAPTMFLPIPNVRHL